MANLFFKAIAIALTAGAITGCSSFSPKDSYITDPKSSQALNVINAAGMNQSGDLKDVSREHLNESVNPTNYVTEASLISSGVLAAGSLSGVTSLAGAGLALAPALLPTQPAAYEFDRWVIWMPKSDLTQDQAVEKVTAIFTDVLSEKYPDTAIHLSDFSRRRHSDQVDGISIHVDRPVEANAPDWLGGYPAYAWGVGPGAMLFGKNILWMEIPTCNTVGRFNKEDQSTIRECLLDLTENLPEWVYMYNAAKLRGGWVATVDDEGGETGSEWRSQIKGASFPVVFSQGNAYLMIEPAKKNEATSLHQ